MVWMDRERREREREKDKVLSKETYKDLEKKLRERLLLTCFPLHRRQEDDEEGGESKDTEDKINRMEKGFQQNI